MRVFLCFLSLFLLFIIPTEASCSKLNCTFLHNDSDWRNSYYNQKAAFDIVVDSPTVTGMITAEFFIDYTTGPFSRNKFQLASSQTGTLNMPLALWFYPKTKVKVLGYLSGQKQGEETFSQEIFSQQIGDYFQISDMNPDFYFIIIGDTKPESNEKLTLQYNYKSDSTWKTFQNDQVRLQDTVRITNEGECMAFKYISVCPDAKPRLCGEALSVVEAQLGETYTLTCSASGAPFLAATWTHDGNTRTDSTETYVSEEAAHRITSKIVIQNFTLEDTGNWTCTIRNKNFGDQVTKTIEYSYSSETRVTQTPRQDFHDPSKDQETFEWTVQGWPLDQITLNCDQVDANKVTKDTSGYRDNVPPLVKFTLKLQDEDQVLCTLRDGDKILDTRNITKIGYGCVAGEKGVEKECEVCPKGETSNPGSLECSPVQSQCEAGSYGEGEDCSPCPWGRTSQVKAVKIQECQAVGSTCEEGEYGTLSCKPCPHGTTSVRHSVKVEDCEDKDSSCGEGFFGIGESCSPCPTDTTSLPNSVKVQECAVAARQTNTKLVVPIVGSSVAVVFPILVAVIVVAVITRVRWSKMARQQTEAPPADTNPGRRQNNGFVL